jgi:YD repeat-containing protein
MGCRWPIPEWRQKVRPSRHAPIGSTQGGYWRVMPAANPRRRLPLLAGTGPLWLTLLIVAALSFAARWRAEHPIAPTIRPELLARPEESGRFRCFVVRPGASGSDPIDARETSCIPSLHDERVNQEIEIDRRTGGLTLCNTDFSVDGLTPLAFTRCLATQDRVSRAFGVGGNHPFDIIPVGTRFPYTYIDLVLADGHSVRYWRVSDGTGYADAVYESFAADTPFLHSRIAWNGDGWDLQRPDGLRIRFPENYRGTRPRHGAPTEMGESGESIRLVRDADRNLEQITVTGGGVLTIAHDSDGRVVTATDNRGRSVRYTYNAEGHLASATDDDVGWTYVYDGPRLTSVIRGSALWLAIGYMDDRVVRLRIADGREFHF